MRKILILSALLLGVLAMTVTAFTDFGHKYENSQSPPVAAIDNTIYEIPENPVEAGDAVTVGYADELIDGVTIRVPVPNRGPPSNR